MAYTWNNKWIWKYESVWCSLEKFKYSNELTSKDLGLILNTSRERAYTTSIYKSLYFSKHIVDKTSISNLLDIDVFQILENDSNLFFDKLCNNLNLEKYIVSKLRYCPKCIKIGYHSIFHQLNFFDDCVFHNIKLKSKCPNCKVENPYLVKFSKATHAFSCECGYSYISETNILNLFNLWLNNTYIKDIEGFKLNQSNLLYTSFNWYKNRKLLKNENYIENNSNIYSLLKNNNISSLFKIKFTYDKITNLESNTYNIGKPLLDPYICTLKAISRHIRRHYIKVNNINYFSRKKFIFLDDLNFDFHTEGISYSDIDAELYAYIMWRKELEGHEDFSTIHEKIKLKGVIDSSYILRMNIMDTEVYKYVENEFSEYIYNYKKEKIFNYHSIVEDAFKRIIGVILWQHFINWLNYAHYKKKKYPYDKIDFSASIPLKINDFFIGHDNKNKLAYIIKVNG